MPEGRGKEYTTWIGVILESVMAVKSEDWQLSLDRRFRKGVTAEKENFP